MSFYSLLTQTCSIYRKTTSKGSAALVTNVWTLIVSEVRCRIDYQFVTSGFLTQTPNGHISGNDYVGYFLPDANILMGDKIIWTNLTLYVRPVNPVYGRNGSVHHYEVPLGLQET